jgi:putative SOS response-associated peptidase YedK
VRPVHERMPVIVPERHYGLWLDPTTQDAGEVMPLLRPYPADAMHAYPVGTKVSNPRNDRPECLAPAP